MKRPVLALAAIGAIALASCTQKSREPFRDAPTKGHDDTPAQIVNMPDGFSNLATKCVGGVRYTAAFKNNDNRASIAVTPGPNNGCPSS